MARREGRTQFLRQVATQRSRVSAALVRALKQKDAALREQAAFAAGRARLIELTKELEELLRDKNADVRRAAYLALGLMDTLPARQPLLAPIKRDAHVQDPVYAASVVGLCWAETDQAIADFALRWLGASSEYGKRFPVWTLGFQNIAACADAIQQTLLTTVDDGVANVACVALGRFGTPGSLDLLCRIGSSLSELEMLPVGARLNQLLEARRLARQALSFWVAAERNRLRDAWYAGKQLTQYARYVERLRREYPFYEFRLDDPTITLEGIEIYRRAQLRGSAAIALGMRNNGESVQESVQALVRALSEPPTLYSSATADFAAMSLGRIGAPAALEPLIAAMQRKTVIKDAPEQYTGALDPVRGHACLALGLFGARNAVLSRSSMEYRKAVEALVTALSDASETAEVRAAAGVALGISRYAEATSLLRRVTEEAGALEGGVELAGYCLLALGMLGDEQVATLSMDFLLNTAGETGTPYLTAQRAALLGACLSAGREQVEHILWLSLRHNYFVRREVALGAALGAVDPIVEDLLELAIRKPGDRVYAVQALGELYDTERLEGRPSKVSLLLAHTNYQHRDEEMLRNA